MGYMDSDMFKEKIVYKDEEATQENKEDELSEDVVEMYKKNKRTVLRFLGYDPLKMNQFQNSLFSTLSLLDILMSL